jgi:proteasome assembly chaperone (PAC2) family protein
MSQGRPWDHSVIILMDLLQYSANPALTNPALVAGFGGWPNAAEVATSTIDYLVEHLGAGELATFSFDDFQLFSLHRPVATIVKGHLKSINRALCRFHFWNNPQGRDLILFSGPEPQIHWHRYLETFLDLCQRFKVETLISLGGLRDDVLHSEEKISGAGASMADIKRLRQLSEPVELIDYVGPTAIHSLLLAAARQHGIEGMSLWGHAASYLQGTNYKLCAGLLRRLSLLLSFELDTTELDLSWRLVEEQIANLIAGNDELRQYIDKLKRREHLGTFEPNPPPPSGKVLHLDRFTKKKEPED